jgi:heme o synthase
MQENLVSNARTVWAKRFRTRYWPLIKSLQTILLLSTGMAGYMSARCPIIHWQTLVGLTGTLLLAISGSTVLNMWYDRDIDAMMKRTCRRPLPSGLVNPREALGIGIVLSSAGVGGAFLLSPLYGLLILGGLFFDVFVYTIWLKRRTSWSIVWGGIAGGMPILAGRALATGTIDWIAILLALAVLFWIPTHIMTFSMRCHADYQVSGIPTFPSAYGFKATQVVITISSLLAAASIGGAAIGLGMTLGYLRVLSVLSVGLVWLACQSLFRPSERVNFGLFKYASVYMLSAMLLVMLQAISL